MDMLKLVKYTITFLNQLKAVNRQDFRKRLLELEFKSNHWINNKMLLKNTASLQKVQTYCLSCKKH